MLAYVRIIVLSIMLIMGRIVGRVIRINGGLCGSLRGVVRVIFWGGWGCISGIIRSISHRFRSSLGVNIWLCSI